MNDEEIIQLYFDRKESAIAASEQKYGGLCRSVARRILPDLRDVEECLSDLWIRIWNAIPPERPGSLRAYLARVMRNLALDKAVYNGADKRKTALEESFEELEPSLCAGGDEIQRVLEQDELRVFLKTFLLEQREENRTIFIRRYWYGESTREIAQSLGASEEKIRSSLFRTRNHLRAKMQKEGVTL